jgi:hypothetical protein
MRRDLHLVEQFCYLGDQEMLKSQAPQLEAVMRHSTFTPRMLKGGEP